MTIADFVQAFAAKVQTDRIHWELRPAGELRGHEPLDADPSFDLLVCPVCFLAERFELYFWDAAPYLRMSYYDAQQLAAAADGSEGHDPALRAQLLAAVKLTDHAPDTPWTCSGCDAVATFAARNEHLCFVPKPEDIVDCDEV